MTGTLSPFGAPPELRDDEIDDDKTVGLGDWLRKALSSDSGHKSPLYPRLLRLRHVHPNGWQRAILVEGMALVGGLAALADLATAWAPVIMPVAAAAVVKFHDVLAGVLPARPGSEQDESGAASEGDAASGSSGES